MSESKALSTTPLSHDNEEGLSRTTESSPSSSVGHIFFASGAAAALAACGDSDQPLVGNPSGQGGNGGNLGNNGNTNGGGTTTGGNTGGGGSNNTLSAITVSPLGLGSSAVSIPHFTLDSWGASRFMTQAATGATYSEIMGLVDAEPEPGGAMMTKQQAGSSKAQKWLAQQLTAPTSSLFDEMVEEFYDPNKPSDGRNGVPGTVWRFMQEKPDVLRQRVAFALSQILVVNVSGIRLSRGYSAANHYDILMNHAFGNFRDLLEAVTLSAAMADFLTYHANRKASADGTIEPDENYAREIMQLFTVGLVELNMDGTPIPGPVGYRETYDTADIKGLARVFTGWKRDEVKGDVNSVRRPLVNDERWHEFGEKKFLNLTIPAGATAIDSLKMTLDHLFNHPNVAPFISKQLIQHLVTSNPSPAYVRRVSEVFANDGNGVRGNLAQVLVAILTDQEARVPETGNTAGKFREPVMRFTQLFRALKAKPKQNAWKKMNLDRPGVFNQTPLRAPSVFNYYRPGFVLPGNQEGLLAPQFQLEDESSLVNYINLLEKILFPRRSQDDQLVPDYAEYEALFDDQAFNFDELVNRLALVLCNRPLSNSTFNEVAAALSAISPQEKEYKRLCVKVAVYLIMASRDYLCFI